MSDTVRIRRIAETDWDGIVALEDRTYTPLGLSEGRAALRSKAQVSPDTCFVLDVASRPAGYLLALPYPPAHFPDLAWTEDPSFVSRNLHLHDMVITPPLRHRGLGRRLFRHLSSTARAHGFERMSLVAVGPSGRFWAACGFAAQPQVAAPAGYGPDAVYMSKPLPPADRLLPLAARHRAARPCATK